MIQKMLMSSGGGGKSGEIKVGDYFNNTSPDKSYATMFLSARIWNNDSMASCYRNGVQQTPIRNLAVGNYNGRTYYRLDNVTPNDVLTFDHWNGGWALFMNDFEDEVADDFESVFTF